MHREAKRNAVDRSLTRSTPVPNELEDDPDLWVGVLTGTPTVFSAGSDLNGLVTATPSAVRTARPPTVASR